jgi:hypothetical protein
MAVCLILSGNHIAKHDALAQGNEGGCKDKVQLLPNRKPARGEPEGGSNANGPIKSLVNIIRYMVMSWMLMDAMTDNIRIEFPWTNKILSDHSKYHDAQF